MEFPFICSSIPAAHAYKVYFSQLIRYSRHFCSYQDFLDQGLLLTRKQLLIQGFLLVKLKSSLRTFYGRHHDLVDRYLCHKWPRICKHTLVLSSFIIYHCSSSLFIARFIRQVPQIDQDLLTLLEHLSSPRYLVGACYSIFSVISWL